MRLHDRSRHVRQESRDRNELVPQLVEEVDEQTANVTAVQILIRHDHYRAVAQVLHISVLLARGETDDLLELSDLLGLLDLGIARVLDVQHLTLEGIDTEQLALVLTETTQSHRLG